MAKQKKENKKKSPAIKSSLFPPQVKQAVDLLLIQEEQRSEIAKQIRLQYPDIEFPPEESWVNYCKKRAIAIKKDAALKKSLELLTREANLLKVDTSNPEAILFGLVEKIVKKIERLEQLNARTHDVGRENVILGQQKLLNDTIKTQMAMEAQGYYINQRLREAAKILSNEVHKTLIQACRDVYGDSKSAELDRTLQALMGPLYWENLESKVTQALIPEKTDG